MRKQDIKTGVVYAYQRNRTWGTPDPIVFLSAPSDGQMYRERDSFSRTGTAFRRDTRDGAKPQRGNFGHGSTGYPVAKLRYDADHSDLTPLITVTLADFEAATSAYASTVIEFDVLTSLGAVTGPYEEKLAEAEARERADQEVRERQHAERLRVAKRETELIARFANLGLTVARGAPGQLALTLDEAAKVAVLLEG